MRMLKTIIKKLLSGILAISILTFSIFTIEDAHNIYLRYWVGNKVVYILNPANKQSGGTGFHVKANSGKVYILTNKHVCGMGELNPKVGKTLLIQEESGALTPKKVVALYPQSDLCLVEGLDHYSGLSVSNLDNTAQQKVYAIGHPLLLPLIVSEGRVTHREEDAVVMIGSGMTKEQCSGPDREFLDPITAYKKYGELIFTTICLGHYEAMHSTAKIWGGNSGSPVVDRLGTVVGVMFAADNRTNNGMFIPIHHVREFLKGF